MPRLLRWTLLVALLALPAISRAQTLEARTISLAGARAMLQAAEAEARKNNWNVSIAIVDAAGELLVFQRMDDASPASVAISQGKARTAARFRRATKLLDSAVTTQGRTPLLAVEGVLPLEGGVPVTVDGKVIGGIGVSGVTSQQDAQIAAAGAGALKP